MKVIRICFIGIICGIASSYSVGLAQDSTSSGKSEAQQPVTPGLATNAAQKAPNVQAFDTTESNVGQEVGPYEIKQSMEFGGRITNYTGNTGTWDTYVNLGTGPRLLEYSFSMHSASHTGSLFDDLTFNNFGYGGDPNNLSRIFLQKGKVYTFNGSFRRDVNIFDYNLLANPLNPVNSTLPVPILNSPHEFLMTRRMGSANLVLFPTSKIQYRAGWSRVTNQGTTFSTFHQGTEAILSQPTSYISDNYSAGISLRLVPRTSLNYDQFYTFFKNDTTAQLDSTAAQAGFGIPAFLLPNGNPVNLGLAFNSAGSQPCASPVVGGFANPTCNGFLSYTRYGRVRTSYPTEQVALQSNYWRRVDLAARAIYSSSDSLMPDYGSLFAGLETRTATVIQNIIAPPGGGAHTSRLSLTSEFGVTLHVTDKFQIVDQFRYNNFREPGNWLYTTNSFFGSSLTTTPNVYSAATCSTITSPGCPQHTSSSGADVITDNLNSFLRQATTTNTFQLDYQFARRLTGYLGYRFTRRNITDISTDNQVSVFYPSLPNRGSCVGLPLVNGVCTVPTVLEAENDVVQINGHSGLLGISGRPTDKWRINADTELYSADNAFTRISPRHLQLYRVKSSYQPNEWIALGGSVNIRENRNTALDIGNLQHNRSYSFNGTFVPVNSKIGVDVAYDYSDIFSQTNICYVSTPTPAGALSCGSPFLTGLSVYKEQTHFGSGYFLIRPDRRVTANLGYTITSSTGTTLILNPNAPTGPLSFNYTLPSGLVTVQLQKHMIFKAGWNYYDYNEKSLSGPTVPRDFRGNVFTLSMRYVM